MSKDKSRRDSNGPVQPENANEFPGGSINTAGGQTRNANVLDALKSVRLTDFKEVHRKPCVRDALLPGIGAGFVMGGIRAIMGGQIFTACTWAVGSFCVGSAAMYEFCQRRRKLEREGMQRVVEVVDRKKSERLKQAKAARAARDTEKESG